MIIFFRFAHSEFFEPTQKFEEFIPDNFPQVGLTRFAFACFFGHYTMRERRNELSSFGISYFHPQLAGLRSEKNDPLLYRRPRVIVRGERDVLLQSSLTISGTSLVLFLSFNSLSDKMRENDKKEDIIIYDNRTPCDVNLLIDGETITLTPNEKPARVEVVSKQVDKVGVIPIFEQEYGEVRGLPKEGENQAIVVSRVVKDACPERDDPYVPCEFIRDEEGRIQGYRGLTR